MNINLINPLVIAYIGDAIYELMIRERLISNNINKVNDLQQKAIKYVSARSQSCIVNNLMDNNVLTDTEIDIYKRARNTKVNSHPSSTDIITYKQATGLEAIFGYLYINNDFNRIKELIDYIMED